MTDELVTELAAFWDREAIAPGRREREIVIRLFASGRELRLREEAAFGEHALWSLRYCEDAETLYAIWEESLWLDGTQSLAVLAVRAFLRAS